MVKNKNIILGVCGGISAYKSVELLRLMVKQGAKVKVIMTSGACNFVGPLTFEALSENPVFTDIFESGKDGGAIRHIDWAREADAAVIAPATANMIGKFANGIADDALSTSLLAVTSKILVCPSMNSDMYFEPPGSEKYQSNNLLTGIWLSKPEIRRSCLGDTRGPGPAFSRRPFPFIFLDTGALMGKGLEPKRDF